MSSCQGGTHRSAASSSLLVPPGCGAGGSSPGRAGHDCGLGLSNKVAPHTPGPAPCPRAPLRSGVALASLASLAARRAPARAIIARSRSLLGPYDGPASSGAAPCARVVPAAPRGIARRGRRAGGVQASDRDLPGMAAPGRCSPSRLRWSVVRGQLPACAPKPSASSLKKCPSTLQTWQHIICF